MSLELELSALSLEDKKVVKLISNDGFARSIRMKAAKKSMVISRLIEDLDIYAFTEKNIEIPLPNVASTELDKVIDFLNNHTDDSSSVAEFREILLKDKIAVFFRDFIEMDQKILVNLYKVSNYLDIETLKELCAWKIVSNIKKDIEIPLPNVASTELEKVIDFLNNHSDDSSVAEFREILLKNKIPVFDRDFIDVDQNILVNLYKVSNYLDIDTLKELCAWKITSNMKGKKPDEINEFWSFENDFSIEERCEVKEGHAWTEQKA